MSAFIVLIKYEASKNTFLPSSVIEPKHYRGIGAPYRRRIALTVFMSFNRAVIAGIADVTSRTAAREVRQREQIPQIPPPEVRRLADLLEWQIAAVDPEDAIAK